MTVEDGADRAEGGQERSAGGEPAVPVGPAPAAGDGDDAGGLGTGAGGAMPSEASAALDGEVLAGLGVAAAIPPVDAWATGVLGIEADPGGAGAWLEGRLAVRVLPPFERSSALVALADAPGLREVVAFAGGDRTAVREVVVGTGPDEERSVPESGSMVAWGDESPVVSWLEVDDLLAPVRLVAVAARRDLAERAADLLASEVRGAASTWRGRSVLLDPSGAELLRPVSLPPADGSRLAGHLEAELDTNVVVPVRCWTEVAAVVQRRAVLLYGPPGSGKGEAVRHVLDRLPGTTAVLVAPRCLLSGDLVRLAYDVAAAAAPALVVLEDLDVVIGDWSVSPAPEGLIELVSQIDGSVRRRGVVTLATTNDAGAGDVVAWQRTGRFDRLVELGPPDDEQRRRIVRALVTRFHHDEGLVELVVARTVGWTHGQLVELERLCVLRHAAGGPVDLVAAVDEVRSQVRSHDGARRAVPGGSYL